MGENSMQSHFSVGISSKNFHWTRPGHLPGITGKMSSALGRVQKQRFDRQQQ